MLKRSYPINQLQIFGILFLCIFSNLQLSGMHLLIKGAGRDAWISVIIAALFYIGWVYCILMIYKRIDTSIPFRLWLENKVGKINSRLLLLPYAAYLLVSSYMALVDITEFTQMMLLMYTPFLVTSFAFIVLCIYLAKSGLRSIAICSSLLVQIILPLVLLHHAIISGKIVHIDLLLPILSEGWLPIWKGVIKVGQAFIDTTIILFLAHYFKKTIKSKFILLFSGLVCVMVLMTVAGVITSFGPVEGAALRYPFYQEWRAIRLSRYIEHLDMFTYIQLLSASLIKIAVSWFIISDLFHFRKWATYVLAGIFLMFSIQRVSDMTYLRWLETYVYPVFVVVILISTFILVFVSLNKRGQA